MRRVRCAIYTRKSSEEGLEQDFNSLDAQREACAAYVLSQASEGWNLLPDVYDDGGVSGGTLERPALQRLLADITAGKIDIIVVYKVDRLTRSLLDFAKLVEAFDKAEVSFVSVTQSFNTTTSMGRLTLNMLLSFAQFEREVTAERIRDKIAASKAKGMWMGGTPPLGYSPDGRTLAVVEEHAAIVRGIYARYLQLGKVRLVAETLEAEGVRTPARAAASGRSFGGRPFSRGQIYAILRNPIYLGDIRHGNKRYKGQHPAVIERAVWNKVQQLLADNTRGNRRCRTAQEHLLAGLMIDAAGEPMLATHATKGDARYRYYVSRSLHHGTGDLSAGLRLPAREIEAVVKEQVAQLFDDPLGLASRLGSAISPGVLRTVAERCGTIAAETRGRSGEALRDIVARVRASRDRLEIGLSTSAIADLIGMAAPESASPALTLCVDYRLTRTGSAIRLVQSDGSRGTPDANLALVNVIVQARKWWLMLREGEIDIRRLAQQEGFHESYVSRVVRAAFLSPQVTDAILSGRQHGLLDAAQLRHPETIPMRWEEQAERFLPGS